MFSSWKAGRPLHPLESYDRCTDDSITPTIIETESVRLIGHGVGSLQKGYLRNIADSVWRGIARHPWEVVWAPQWCRGTGKDMSRVLPCMHINRISRVLESSDRHSVSTGSPMRLTIENHPCGLVARLRDPLAPPAIVKEHVVAVAKFHGWRSGFHIRVAPRSVVDKERPELPLEKVIRLCDVNFSRAGD